MSCAMKQEGSKPQGAPRLLSVIATGAAWRQSRRASSYEGVDPTWLALCLLYSGKAVSSVTNAWRFVSWLWSRPTDFLTVLDL